uniref:Uncharacterized protein n=1 Tax=Arundo donax TaxID=35708 RepID=A0A0A9ABN8_ARUDO
MGQGMAARCDGSDGHGQGGVLECEGRAIMALQSARATGRRRHAPPCCAGCSWLGLDMGARRQRQGDGRKKTTRGAGWLGPKVALGGLGQEGAGPRATSGWLIRGRGKGEQAGLLGGFGPG